MFNESEDFVYKMAFRQVPATSERHQTNIEMLYNGWRQDADRYLRRRDWRNSDVTFIFHH